ncbi:PadR family transcriptional regulator [Oceanicola sp. 22II-s10i]|uniref:bifunctional helix-turn-helix transcriptional regulator/GNAT family N-acetyltransferase n=1 Tax=Oceanicola sp. 22II-s10i TaxID=1317116 RepID=UPI000B526AFF|nr:helix-turn-helix domain-containing GNAT family N-acetyltransferase [Oceanicola sp. 22II-s10i]OWU83542.1 PadR family transcriptional regulator [Oceanicola sp. 22II-s10i]
MKHDPVARIRRFNRAVTAEVGALDDSFLGRGRSLGAARVLNAIGHGIADVAALRAYLNLDSGLTSRLLRGLESEGLVETRTDPADARRRLLSLTAQGEAEYAAYEQLSDDRVRDLLRRHPKPDALLAAMDLVATALARDRIEMVEMDPRAADAVHCLQSYYAELARRFSQGFDVSLSRDPEATAMIRPRGSFIVAVSDGLPIGCAGLKGDGGKVAEIKRMWVAPEARGLGLARQMMSRLEADAAELGVEVLRLDTNSALPEAVALYRNSGWTEIERFNDDPYPDHFFEKRIDARDGAPA